MVYDEKKEKRERELWRAYTPEELENKVKNNPVTEKGLFNLGIERIIKVEFLDIEGRGICLFCGLGKSDKPRYLMFLNCTNPRRIQEETFFHELLHILWGVGGLERTPKENEKKVEEIIERETMEGIKRFPYFIDWMFSCYENNYYEINFSDERLGKT